jgi:hypothetical protein
MCSSIETLDIYGQPPQASRLPNARPGNLDDVVLDRSWQFRTFQMVPLRPPAARDERRNYLC